MTNTIVEYKNNGFIYALVTAPTEEEIIKSINRYIEKYRDAGWLIKIMSINQEKDGYSAKLERFSFAL